MSGRVYVTSNAGFDVQSRFPEEVARAALLELTAEAQGQIRDRIVNTVDSAGHKGRTFTGQTMNAVQPGPVVLVRPGLYRQEVRAVAPHEKVMLVIEDGRKPGKGVSQAGQQNLKRWVRRKLGVAADKLDQVVYLVARKIQLRGIPGIHPFRRTAEAMRAGRARAIFQGVQARLAARYR